MTGSDTPAPPAETDADAARRWARDATTFVSIVLTAVLGRAIFVHSPWPLFLGAIAGIAGGLGCAGVLDAVAVAALGSGLGTVTLLVAGRLGPPPAEAFLVPALEAAVLAGAVALAVALAARASARLTPLFALLGLVIVLGGAWLYALNAASTPVSAAWVTGSAGRVEPFVDALKETPRLTAISPDESLFLLLARDVSVGRPIYPSQVAVLDASNRAHPGEPVPLDEATSYRLPTLFWLFGALPQNGTAEVLAGLVLLSATSVAAYLLTRRYVDVPAALVACTATAAYGAALVASPALLFSEFWAGGLGLVALALAAHSFAGGKRLVALQAAAAAVALLAALTRELAVAFLLVGLAASLVDAESRARRLWALWAVALALFAGAYALHVHAALSAYRAAGVPSGLTGPVSRIPWLHADGKGLAASVALAALALGLSAGVMWAAWALGVVGALAVEAGRAERMLLGLAVVGGTAVLAVAHSAAGPSGSGQVPGFWGMVVIPSVLACVPLVLSRLGAGRVPPSRSAT